MKVSNIKDIQKFFDVVESWQRISKGERTIVTILLFCLKYLFRSLSVFIQNQCVLFLLWHTNTVIRTFYRSEIAYYQKVFKAEKQDCDNRPFTFAYPLPAYGVAVFQY